MSLLFAAVSVRKSSIYGARARAEIVCNWLQAPFQSKLALNGTNLECSTQNMGIQVCGVVRDHIRLVPKTHVVSSLDTHLRLGVVSWGKAIPGARCGFHTKNLILGIGVSGENRCGLPRAGCGRRRSQS